MQSLIEQDNMRYEDLTLAMPFATKDEMAASTYSLLISGLAELDKDNHLRVTKKGRLYMDIYEKMAKMVNDVY